MSGRTNQTCWLVTYHYLIQGKCFKAAMQTVYAYPGFFFILANGWDNKGYQRLFSRDRKAFDYIDCCVAMPAVNRSYESEER